MNRRKLLPQPAADTIAVGSASTGGDIDLFARTLWGEAAGESVRGIEALAAVVMNRAALLPGRSLEDACRGFPCWSHDNPVRSRMLGLKAPDRGGDASADTLLFTTCLRIARRAAVGLIEDPTFGATRYHDRSILPDWTSGLAPTAEIGNRLFYADLSANQGASP
jgi:N-acetylmuramoyl-L-alanine amidase